MDKLTAIDQMKKTIKRHDPDADVDLEMNKLIKGIYKHDMDEDSMSGDDPEARAKMFELYTNIRNEHEAYLHEGTAREQLKKLFEFDCPNAKPETITSVCDLLVESYLEDGEVTDALKESLRSRISNDEAYEDMIALIEQIIEEG